MSCPIPHDEDQRLEALYALGILGSSPDPVFEVVTSMAARSLGAPMASISFIDAQREWLLAAVGMERGERSRGSAICAHAVVGDSDVFTVPDLTRDPRFATNPQVLDGLRSYAGAPVRFRGMAVGVLSVRDTVPRCFEESERAVLRDCASLLSRHLEVRQEARAAQGAARAKSEFFANVSHEIRTPMTAIIGYADLLREPGLAPDQIAHFVETIRRNGQTMLRLVSDILELSRFESGEVVVRESLCAPMGIIAQVERQLRQRAAAKGLSFDVDYIGAMPSAIRTDPARVRHVLQHLVERAIECTERGGVRIVTQLQNLADEAGATLRIDVVDTGDGIHPDEVERLFEPFSPPDATSQRLSGAARLGLCVARRFAHALGGAITVASTPTRGCTFTLTLRTGPIDPDELVDPRGAGDHESDGADEIPAGWLSGRILLVEDGQDNRHLLAHQLRKAGAEVDIAEDGRAGVERALAAMSKSTPYDLILMDMQMPVMSGYEAMRRLRDAGLRNPIVAVTAHALPEDRGRCFEAGADDYLAKPIPADTLVRTCAAWMDLARAGIA